MACKVVKLKGGEVALVNARRGAKLTERDLKTLEEYAAFRRARAETEKQKGAKCRE